MSEIPEKSVVSEAESPVSDEKEIEKQKQLEQEKQELLQKVISGNIENIKDRVAYILNNSNDARNSDIELAWAYTGPCSKPKRCTGISSAKPRCWS